jgi:Transglycosylase SLT domain
MRHSVAFGCISSLVLGALMPLSTVAGADKPATYCGTERWRGFIQEAAARSNIDPAWIDAVIRVESAGCEAFDGKPVTSKFGAMGLMQLMPTTWDAMRQRLNLGSDPYDPHDNILAGTEWLRELHERYGSSGFFAAYQAGTERYDDFLAGRRPLPEETLNYIARIEEALLRASPDSMAGPGYVRAARTPFVHHHDSVASLALPLARSPFVSLAHVDRGPPGTNTTAPKQSNGELARSATDAP